MKIFLMISVWVHFNMPYYPFRSDSADQVFNIKTWTSWLKKKKKKNDDKRITKQQQ